MIDLTRLAAGTGLIAMAAIGTCSALAGVAETMEKECLARLSMPAGGCACIGQRAERELTPKQQEFVVAIITKDAATSARLRGELTVTELTQAGTWMTQTPGRCASQ